MRAAEQTSEHAQAAPRCEVLLVQPGFEVPGLQGAQQGDPPSRAEGGSLPVRPASPLHVLYFLLCIIAILVIVFLVIKLAKIA
jgi:hypothetical protein